MDPLSNSLGYSQLNGQPSSGLLRFRSAPSSLFLGPADTGHHDEDGALSFQEFENKSGVKEPASVNYGSSGLPPHYPTQSCSGTSSSTYGLFGSDGNSCVSRQSSSPSVFFGFRNGCVSTKGVGNYAGLNGTDGEASPRSKHQLNFSSRVPSSFGMSSQIVEVGSNDIEAAGGSNESRYFNRASVPYGSWNASHLPDNVNKRDQPGEMGDRLQLVSHHLSLPKTSPEIAAMEKFFHYQDSIPCKIRAKRGCATHPRSIAERVRRTRISERMRKLQDLVPNMDKQTNTTDMLDLAVDYIKDLQRQYKILSENRANCKCRGKQTPVQRQLG